MRKIFLATLLFAFMLSTASADEGKKYGKDISLEKTTKIEDILAAPEEYVGKKVLIEGTITDVCATRGCWINVAGPEGYQTIKVKVNDGEIVFPMEAKGKTALVEGEVYAIAVDNPTSECSEEMKEGESCSETEKKDSEMSHAETKEGESSCCSSDKKSTVYQIKGLGAVIK
ncbi:MAG: DUF4920 domain-containing protein [Melioribacteraceae bacterium]|nr:DUF4920 domain-containing protein [Melioribacteraceae bacterium]MCF8356685.1 DUF4920 domain-containing protein [Melioribacteraceae bacterium]MCF8395555.1 DUF4920 domain-containing protein [Melioribacteraceae bacterium]MCF8420855.1 DUF4920 domain-containing protein [Melioribacteraceae bacterium]